MTSRVPTSIGGTLPLVYGIVVGTNDRQWLHVCLETLLASNYPALRIIYVDNQSTDGSVTLVAEMFPQVMILNSEANLGFAGANNKAMKLALEQNASYVFLVNPDTRTPQHLVTRLVDFMEMYLSYGIIGPLQYTYCDETASRTLNAWSTEVLANGERHVFYRWEPWRLSPAGAPGQRADGTLEHAYVQGAAFFVRRIVLERVGLFDETFHTFYEETDLCRLARWAGFRVAIVLDLSIEHWGGGQATSDGTGYRRYHMTRNKYYFLFTDAEYTVWQALHLASRWFLLDVKLSLSAFDSTVCPFGQLLNIVWWLVSNMLLIRKQRVRRVNMYRRYKHCRELNSQ